MCESETKGKCRIEKSSKRNFFLFSDKCQQLEMCISRTCFCQWVTIICGCILSIYNGLWCALLQSFDPAFFQIIDSSLFFLCLSSVEGVIVHFKYTAYMAGISLYSRLQNFAMGKRTWKLHRKDLYTLPLHWQNAIKNDDRHFEAGIKQTSFRMCKALDDDNTSHVSFHHECVHRESILAVCTSTMLTDQWMRDCTYIKSRFEPVVTGLQ